MKTFLLLVDFLKVEYIIEVNEQTKGKLHMKKPMKISIILFLLFLSSFFSQPIKAETESYDAVYFGSYNCLVCQSLENSKVLEDITNAGYNMHKYMSEDNYKLFEEMFTKYAVTYNVPKNKNLVPILYAGDKFYAGVSDITDAINSGEIFDVMDQNDMLPLKNVIYSDLTLNDLIVVISSTVLLGFLDAFNPCALAMLLMFLSFLTSKERSKAIGYICFFYILAVFLTYFALGAILQSVLTYLVPYMIVFYVVIIVLALFIAVLNFLDFLSTRKKAYHNVKNQLPKRVFVVTKKIMKNFSEKIDQESPSLYALAFLIGVFVAIIEFPCSGQAFVAWTAIVVDRTSHQLIFYVLLTLYVLLFVSPLVIISFIGLKSKNIMSISNFVRNRLEIIKLFNAIIFLGVAIYYIVKVFIS